MWDLATGITLRTLQHMPHDTNNFNRVVCGVAFSPDGALALTAGMDSRLCLWRTADGAAVDVFTADEPLRCAALGADGLAAVGTNSGKVIGLRLHGVVTADAVAALDAAGPRMDAAGHSAAQAADDIGTDVVDGGPGRAGRCCTIS